MAAELLPSRNQPARDEHKIRFKTDSISHMLINEFSMNIICIIFVECNPVYWVLDSLLYISLFCSRMRHFLYRADKKLTIDVYFVITSLRKCACANFMYFLSIRTGTNDKEDEMTSKWL